MDKDERLNKINKISSDYLEHIKDRISVQLPISEMREIRKLSEREGIIKEKVEWVSILLSYAEGKKWDTGGVWVCERHPHLPFEMGYAFDCQCGAPGKPPFCFNREPLQEDHIKQFNNQFGFFEFGDAQGAKTIKFVRAIEKAHGIIDTDKEGLLNELKAAYLPIFFRCKCGENIEGGNTDEHQIICPKCRRVGCVEQQPF